MSTWKARLAKRLTFLPGRMHPFPCSALLTCFGSTQDNPPFDQPSVVDTQATVCGQPLAKASRNAGSTRGAEVAPEPWQDSGSHVERNGGTKKNASNHSSAQPAQHPQDYLPGPLDGEAATFQTSIPRPSIIEMPTVSGYPVFREGTGLEDSSGHLENDLPEITLTF